MEAVLPMACFFLLMTLGGGIGGLILGLVLRRAQPAVGREDVPTIVFGWMTGLGAGGFIGWFIFLFFLRGVWIVQVHMVISMAVGGAIAGAIGSGVMFWQLARARRRAAESG
jgi:hypothetical protein